jgi:hypothetical protein
MKPLLYAAAARGITMSTCMEANCATTDRKLPVEQKILSISDEAFMLLCLIDNGQWWFAEVVKSNKILVRNLLLLSLSCSAASTTYHENQMTYYAIHQTEKETNEDEKNPARKCTMPESISLMEKQTTLTPTSVATALQGCP